MKSNNFLITIHIDHQIKSIIKRNLSRLTFSSCQENICDVRDGIHFKNIEESENMKLISLSFNTVGINIFKFKKRVTLAHSIRHKRN